ncbi:MAG TPA: hypothetical protein VHJ59_07375 [Nitrososphaera sp.]|nr:hypothetical protein [Nitrososphaera sp.]
MINYPKKSQHQTTTHERQLTPASTLQTVPAVGIKAEDIAVLKDRLDGRYR